MPFKPEADTYTNDPNTTLEQLRLACEILALDPSGAAEELRARINEYLNQFEPGVEIVCLNPEPPKSR